MSQRLSFHGCTRVFELLGYYPDLEDANVYVSGGSVRGPKAFVAFAEALESVDPAVLKEWLVQYQGMSPADVQIAIDRALQELLDQE